MQLPGHGPLLGFPRPPSSCSRISSTASNSQADDVCVPAHMLHHTVIFRRTERGAAGSPCRVRWFGNFSWRLMSSPRLFKEAMIGRRFRNPEADLEVEGPG